MSSSTVVDGARSSIAGSATTHIFESLVRRYRPAVRRACAAFEDAATDAEDLTQEVFLRAYLNLERLRDPRSASAWLFRIQRNHCLNHVRNRRTSIPFDEDLSSIHDDLQTAPVGPERVDRDALRRRLERAIDALPERQRKAVLLRDVDGLSYRHVADRLGLGLSAAKMRVARGRRTLHGSLAAESAS